MNRKAIRIIISFLIFSLQSAIVSASTPDKYVTEVYMGYARYASSNGRYWNVLKRQAKITFLHGIEEGFSLLELHLYESNFDPNTLKSIADIIQHDLLVSGLRFSDLVDQVDKFYTDSLNLQVPIMEAYRYAIKKLRGAPQTELDQMSAAMRKAISK
jgi:hypothetical protein